MLITVELPTMFHLLQQIKTVWRSVPAHSIKPLLVLLLGLIVPLWGLGWLSTEVFEAEHARIEFPWMQAIHAHATHALDGLAMALSVLGGLPVMAVLSLILAAWVWRTDRVMSHLLWLAMLGAACIMWMMKQAFDRPRPLLWPRLVKEYGASFPSGHSVYAVVFGVMLIVLSRHWPQQRWVIVAAIGWMLLMGLSRVYLGVHYPSDVLAGWAVGLIWSSGAWLIVRPHHHAQQTHETKRLSDTGTEQ